MAWIAEHWQTVVALTIVGGTAAVFLWRGLRRKERGCGGGCDCAAKKTVR